MSSGEGKFDEQMLCELQEKHKELWEELHQIVKNGTDDHMDDHMENHMVDHMENHMDDHMEDHMVDHLELRFNRLKDATRMQDAFSMRDALDSFVGLRRPGNCTPIFQ